MGVPCIFFFIGLMVRIFFGDRIMDGIEPETFWAKGPSEPSAFRDMESGMPHGKDSSLHKWPCDGFVYYIEYQSFP